MLKDMITNLKNLSKTDWVILIMLLVVGGVLLSPYWEYVRGFIYYAKELNGKLEAVSIALSFSFFGMFFLFFWDIIKPNYLPRKDPQDILIKLISINLYSPVMIFFIVLLLNNYGVKTIDLTVVLSIFSLVAIYINNKRRFTKTLSNALVDNFEERDQIIEQNIRDIIEYEFRFKNYSEEELKKILIDETNNHSKRRAAKNVLYEK